MNIIILILLVAQIATEIDGVDVLVRIPEDQAEIKEAIANMTKQNEITRKEEERRWVELKSELKGIKRKIDELESETLMIKGINTSASKPKPLPASTPDAEPSPTPKIRGILRKLDDGTAGASSTCCPNCCSARNAFIPFGEAKEHEQLEQWASETDQFPAYIWMRFQRPHRLAKIAFSSLYYKQLPKEIGVVGSDDCETWTTLVTIKSGFTYGSEVKPWEIPSQNRQKFSCIGLMWPRRFEGNDGIARLGHITMWEEL